MDALRAPLTAAFDRPMSDPRRTRRYGRALLRIFSRPLRKGDAVPEARLRRAEKRLGVALPGAMRDYYLLAGSAAENREHNVLFTPDELALEGGYLVFMEENQAVVHWGIPLSLTRRADPQVWQRVNADIPEWHSEDMTFSVFIVKNLAWQRGVELWNNRMHPTSGAMAKRRPARR